MKVKNGILIAIFAILAISPTSQRTVNLATESLKITRSLQTSMYSNSTTVDYEKGVFNFDCSGLIRHLLMRNFPDALSTIVKASNRRFPRAIDFFSAIEQNETVLYWKKIKNIEKSRKGDLLIWRHKHPKKGATGHIVIINKIESLADNQFVKKIEVFDSAKSPHYNDSRSENESGFGKGWIWIHLDNKMYPIAYQWKNRQNMVQHKEMVIARLKQ